MNERSGAATQAVRTQGNLAKYMYSLALPAMKDQFGYINQSLKEGGEPGYVRDAYELQRTAITDALSRQGQAARSGALAQSGQAVRGGNVTAGLTPEGMGAKIADQVYASQLNQGLGKIEQMNKLMQLSMGQTVQAGSASIGAGQAQLQGIAGMNPYNSTYAGVLAAANLAGTGYGAYQQWNAGRPGLQPGAQLPMPTNYSAFNMATPGTV